jgi:nitronate monooxygenase
MAGDPGKLCHLLDIERPVLCAPMAGIAGGRLAAAVTAGGGLGFVGSGYGNPDWLDREMAQTDGARVGIGLITWRIDAATVANALQHRPAALWLSFDDPRPYAEAVHEAGVALICQVGSLDEARQAIEAEAEVIVAQGSESGGHGQSNRALFGLLPAVVEEADPIPVVAAGGISDRHGYEAAVALGGAGVALGTRLYATHEAPSTRSRNYQQGVLSYHARSTG